MRSPNTLSQGRPFTARTGEQLRIDTATQRDLPQVLDLVRDVIFDMNKNGNEQWNEEYPKPGLFESDIQNKEMHAMKDGGKIVGIITLSEKQDKQYDDIKWTDRLERPLMVHRLAVHPKWHRKGIATKLMEFAGEYAQKHAYSSIRLDTYHKNERSRAMFLKMGYLRRPGHIHFPECRGPYYCYELVHSRFRPGA